jgi:hypothetical protein
MIQKGVQKIKKTILPTLDNSHRPQIFHEHSLLTILVLSQLLLLISFTFYSVLRETQFGNRILISDIISLTNKERIKRNLNPLTENQQLMDAAHVKGDDMISKRYFAHFSPNGTTPWNLLESKGYLFKTAGENLAINFTNSKDTVNAWMQSPKHRANILNTTYTDTGVAIVPDIYRDESSLLVVQMFGSQDIPVSNKINNHSQDWYKKLLVNSSLIIEYIYLIIAIILCISLLAMITVEASRKHTKHILYGVCLFFVMIICLLVNMKLL